jgi:hypothetical protein
MMKKLYLLLAVLVAFLPGAARATGCASLPYTFNTGVTIDANQMNADLNLLLKCIGSGTFIQGLASVSSFTALEALPTSPGAVVMLTGYYQNGDIPPVVYIPLSIPCPLNGGLGDGGSQAPSFNSLCWQALYPGTGADIRSWGVHFDGLVHSGNAASFEAAVNSGFALTVPIGTGCAILDGEVSSAGSAALNGPGNQSGACIKPGNGIAPTDGALLYFSGAGASLTARGFLIDGNQAGETSHFAAVSVANGASIDSDIDVQNTSGDGVDFNGSAAVKVRGTFANIGTISGANQSGTAVNIGSGCAESNCTLGASNNLDVDVGVKNANFAGVGVGYAVGGNVTVRCDTINPTGAWGECITAYYQGNSGIVYHGTVTGGGAGNHCFHLGGSNIKFYGTANTCTFDGVLIESRYNETDGTISTSGNVVTGSGGQRFDLCYHNCQRSTNYTDASGMFRFNGVSYFVSYCSSPTSCVLATTPPPTTNATYLLTYFGPTINPTVDLSSRNTVTGGAGLHAAIQCAICRGGVLSGYVANFVGKGEGVICADCVGTLVNFGSNAAFYAGVDINSSFATGTNEGNGTINVTNGLTAFTGNSTFWQSGNTGSTLVGGLAPGDICKDTTNNDKFDETVATRTSENSGTWVAAYAGTTGTNHNYVCGTGSNGVLVNASAIGVQQIAPPVSAGGFGVLVANSQSTMVYGNYAQSFAEGFNDAGANTANVFFGLGTVPGAPVMGDIVPLTYTGAPTSSFSMHTGVNTHQ